MPRLLVAVLVAGYLLRSRQTDVFTHNEGHWSVELIRDEIHAMMVNQPITQTSSK